MNPKEESLSKSDFSKSLEKWSNDILQIRNQQDDLKNQIVENCMQLTDENDILRLRSLHNKLMGEAKSKLDWLEKEIGIQSMLLGINSSEKNTKVDYSKHLELQVELQKMKDMFKELRNDFVEILPLRKTRDIPNQNQDAA